eukprot:TRINITY_DN12450_c0_g2_i4.p1 TRINITY_DN12450_c0_g2~~TRINITY_DN12450_c0_g2_i4.p1  ORF type:complete len:190 (-),score=12.31 TRINITY_DN12450_c0_g2_i4:134-703(-)
MRASALYMSIKVNEETTEDAFRGLIVIFSSIGIILSAVTLGLFILLINFVPRNFANGKSLAPYSLVRAAVTYGFCSLIASILQLMIKWAYNPKTFFISYFLWLLNLILCIVLAIPDFHRTLKCKQVGYVDFFGIGVIVIYLLVEGILVGKKYNKLKKEEIIQMSMRSTIYQSCPGCILVASVICINILY